MDKLFHAMELGAPGRPLQPVNRAMPIPDDGEIRIAITACGVCRTDLHIADGDIMGPLPIIPGHEIVGRVEALGAGVTKFEVGDRVGVPWLGRSCGTCHYCATGHENLCDAPAFTGFTRDGGFASHVVADARFCLAIPAGFDDLHAAPLLCAGLIGYRAYRMADGAKALGLYGFGAAAHILAQLAIADGADVYAFTREGDMASQEFARRLGCIWAGASNETPPTTLDAAILFAPVGALVPEALRHVRKGGRVICAGIHMSDIPSFPYADLWEERSIHSVANLTRADGAAFFEAAARCGMRTHVTALPLADANRALVLVPEGAARGNP